MGMIGELTSKIIHLTPDQEKWNYLVDAFLIRELINSIPSQVDVQFMIFEITLHQPGSKKTVYCCFSGGRIKKDVLDFTPIGKAAFIYLTLIPSETRGFCPSYITLRKGKTPIREQIIEAIRKAPPETRICFVGDFQGRLDGEIFPAINFTGTTIKLSSKKARS